MDRPAFPVRAIAHCFWFVLQVLFDGGELVALDHTGVASVKNGMLWTIRQSKADQKGDRVTVRIAKGSCPYTWPVPAMDTPLDRSKIRFGPFLLASPRAGTLVARLTGSGVWKILYRLAAEARLKAEEGRHSLHSMRASFITEAHLDKALGEQVMARGIMASRETVREWVNRFGRHFAHCLRCDGPPASDKWHLDGLGLEIAALQMFVAVEDKTAYTK